MNVHDILGNKVVQAASIGVVSFGAGACVGYILGKKRAESSESGPEQLTFTYETTDNTGQQVLYEIIEESVNESQADDMLAPQIEHISLDDEIVASPVVANMIEEGVIQWLGETEDEDEDDSDDVVTHNVFDSVTEGWDYEAEKAKRTSNDPYIIHVDEFVSDNLGYSQTTLTYYNGDEVVTDESDVPVYNYTSVLGSENLKFGHGSNSDSVVYIRNEERKAEYEVLLFDGSYEQERLGLVAEEEAENELLHSDYRFRSDE